jgi:hypothetical protein
MFAYYLDAVLPNGRSQLSCGGICCWWPSLACLRLTVRTWLHGMESRRKPYPPILIRFSDDGTSSVIPLLGGIVENSTAATHLMEHVLGWKALPSLDLRRWRLWTSLFLLKASLKHTYNHPCINATLSSSWLLIHFSMLWLNYPPTPGFWAHWLLACRLQWLVMSSSRSLECFVSSLMPLDPRCSL